MYRIYDKMRDLVPKLQLIAAKDYHDEQVIDIDCIQFKSLDVHSSTGDDGLRLGSSNVDDADRLGRGEYVKL